MRLTAILRLLCLGAVTLLPGIAAAELQWHVTPANAALGGADYDLHLLTMIIIAVIFVGVFSFMFYAIFKHRRSAGSQEAHFHQNTTVEIIWTVIPALILIGVAWPATRTLLEMRDASAPDITIKATGYQWKWEYEYLDDGIKFYSSLSIPRAQVEGAAAIDENYLLEVENPMVVPVGKKVRILTAANDVPHVRYVPELAVKQAAVAGFARDTWFRAENTGTFRGPCAEFCGEEYGLLPIVVKVVSKDDFKIWLAKRKSSAGVTTDDSNKEYSVSD